MQQKRVCLPPTSKPVCQREPHEEERGDHAEQQQQQQKQQQLVLHYYYYYYNNNNVFNVRPRKYSAQSTRPLTTLSHTYTNIAPPRALWGPPLIIMTRGTSFWATRRVLDQRTAGGVFNGYFETALFFRYIYFF